MDSIKKNDIVRLTRDGAYNPEKGEYFGAKGQLARSVSDDFSDFVLLSPREDQFDGVFYLERERVEKI
jgi:hypothetical protein